MPLLERRCWTFVMLDVCKNNLLGCLENPTPDRITTDLQRFNTKLNLTTRNMQTLIFPKTFLTGLNRANRRNLAQNSNNFLCITIRAALYVAHQTDPDLVYEVFSAMTHVWTIDNA
jgi:hypothetical protein